MTTPAELYRNAVDLNRFSNGVARRIALTYNDLILEAVDRLRGLDELSAPAKAARLRAILAQLKGSLDNWAGTSTLVMTEELQGLAVLQSQFVSRELRRALPEQLDCPLVALWDALPEAVAIPKPIHSGCMALTSSLLKPLGRSLVALVASKAVMVANPSVALRGSVPLLRCLLVVHKGEVVVCCHPSSEPIQIGDVRLRHHVPLVSRLPQ